MVQNSWKTTNKLNGLVLQSVTATISRGRANKVATKIRSRKQSNPNFALLQYKR
eukprot:gene5548-4003_t